LGQTGKQRLAAGGAGLQVKPKILNALALAAGAAAAVLMLSVFFALLVIPGGIIAYLVWRKFRKLQSQPADESLTAEYTVIKDADKQ